MSHLAPCPHCNRHVRVSESACPFCAASLAGRRVQPRPQVATRGLSRASILALGASMAAVAGGALLDGCADEPEPEDDGSSSVPLYGAPVQPDAGNVVPDAGSGVAIYGAPIQPDGGSQVAPMYGSPIQPSPDAGQNDAGPTDAGKEAGSVWGDAGRVGPVYGAPVPIYGAPVQPPIDSDED